MDAAAPERRTPRWLHLLGQAVSWTALFVTGLAALVLIVIPFATGSQTYSVLTNSMAPKYAPGTLLVVKPVDFQELVVGDVITYQIESGRPDVVTHRIVAITADQEGKRLLVTQGDNNDVIDENPVMEQQVRGRIFYAVPYAGFVATSLGQAPRGWISSGLAVVLIGAGLITIVRGVFQSRQPTVTPARALDDNGLVDAEASR